MAGERGPLRLKDEVVLVTGGSRGIGCAIALRFANAGYFRFMNPLPAVAEAALSWPPPSPAS